MDLVTAELRSGLRQFPLGSQEGLFENAKVLVKFFFPAGRYTFFVTEAEPRGKNVLFFGFCVSALGADCDEWGYTSLTELLSARVRGLSIERDLHVPFAARTVGELRHSAA
jgi:Protein of unknown function (DUF2958)